MKAAAFALVLLFLGIPTARANEASAQLSGALLGETPLLQDLRQLTDEIGGRPTGSEANRRAVAWGLERFREAGVEARTETFGMPALWLERSASARVGGDVAFEARAAAMPFSAGTPSAGATAPLLDAGSGSESDFARLGSTARGAFVLIETEELLDLDGLFREYAEAAEVERRAFAVDVAGVAYMGSRPRGLLYRHNVSIGERNRRPMLILERESAQRALRLLRAGRHLTLTASIAVEGGRPYQSANVIGEIRGSELPDEIVIVGAHLDSWDLGTGALDNGCNVAMVLDMARQIRKLGLRPRRTLRFALWNGEEQGMNGSWAYAKSHAAELDRHVMAASFDIGSGRITGFFTNGRPELDAAVARALAPLAALGPFVQVPEPVVGTDNYDFMMEGVANLVANQESANYGPNYHARSDTFDKVDQRQLKQNAAIAAAVTWDFANADVTWGRQSRKDIETLVDSTTLKAQMIGMNLWDDWTRGVRGRRK
jgi:carboxypeptidase Q